MSDRAPLVLFAEDDDEDWFLIEDTFRTCQSPVRLERVKNGRELMDRLREEAKDQPGLVLLDLKMPQMDGHEALMEIRGDDALRHIPVVIMTASKSEADIFRAYYNGANSYVAKPVSQDHLEVIHQYWAEVVEYPTTGET